MPNRCDNEYASLLSDVLRGETVNTRNSVVNRRIAKTVEFHGTPLVSARKTAWKTALREWEWFMSGSCDINDAHPSVRPWWEPWADKKGLVRNNYSVQFREFHGRDGSVDQIEALVAGVRDHPNSRRNVITTWNTADMLSPETPITNCWGTVIQVFDDWGGLHLVTYQRSVDAVCGLPHNLVQMWAFLLWLAHRTGKPAAALVWIGGDVHVYQEHNDLAWRIIHAAEKARPTPNLVYRPTTEDFRADDFTLDCEYAPVLTERAKMIV